MRITQAQFDEHQRRHGFGKSAQPDTRAVEVFDDAVEAGTEAKLQREVYQWLMLNGASGIVWHRTDKKSTCSIGVSDFVFLWNNKYFAAEAKSGNREPNKSQLDFIDIVNANGGVAFVFRSLPEFTAKLASV